MTSWEVSVLTPKRMVGPTHVQRCVKMSRYLAISSTTSISIKRRERQWCYQFTHRLGQPQHHKVGARFIAPSYPPVNYILGRVRGRDKAGPYRLWREGVEMIIHVPHIQYSI